ncbi:MAG: ABC transporter ATP-binding protein/permease [Desulfarculaceae bacterium]|nr:ABC transporter ATP-binding protein/permease [Desulfarculaceae bacterium]
MSRLAQQLRWLGATMAHILEMTSGQKAWMILLGLMQLCMALWDGVLYGMAVVAAQTVISPEDGGFAAMFKDVVAALGMDNHSLPALAIMGTLAAMLVRGGLEYLIVVVETHFLVRAATALRVRLFRVYMRATQTFLDEYRISRLDQMLKREVRTVCTSCLEFFKGAGASLSVAVILALLIQLNVPLTAFVAASLLLVLFFKYAYTRYVKHVAQEALDRRILFWRQIKEYVSGLQQIKLAGVALRVVERFGALSYELEHLFQKQKRIKHLEPLLIQAQGLVIVGLVVWVGIKGLFIGEPLPVAGVISFLLVLRGLMPALGKLASNVSSAVQFFPSAEFVYYLYNLPAEHLEAEGGLDKRPLLEKELVLRDLRLDYRKRPRVVSGLNLRVGRGERVGIVGPSGSGKSSLAHALLRLYEPVEGNIAIDGVPLKEVSLEALRRGMGLVSQTVHLFDLSVREIICLSSGTCDERRMVDAARRANAHGFIMNLPEGFDTVVGEMGSSLSGGERQRLMIAQVFYKDPEIIILDEATSSLDSRAEAEIQQSLEELGRDKTQIIIAHRLATLVNVDRIYVLHKGRLVEQGTWRELRQRGGLFAEMVAQQDLMEAEHKAGQ